eukprot:TRINITY_DN17994_c0_g1_i1.p1 TRINITY_DN17994_c0_g1~~TRINITY_DN17994_c0_g1_i1.p1  ORF type:complete len:426 (+),score=53.72 TRINITY_DN17994_c0_g1_i1:49-1278(+)
MMPTPTILSTLAMVLLFSVLVSETSACTNSSILIDEKSPERGMYECMVGPEATGMEGMEVHWTSGTVTYMALRSQTEGWLGVGLSEMMKMAPSKAVVASNGLPETYDIRETTAAGVVKDKTIEKFLGIPSSSDMSYELKNGWSTLRLLFSLSAINQGQANDTIVLNIARDPFKPALEVHLHEHRKSVKVDLESGSGFSHESDHSYWVSVHGAMMSVAWIILVPAGIGFKIAGRTDRKMFFFFLHMTFMTLAVIVITISFAVAFYKFEHSKEETTDTGGHNVVGIVLYTGFVVQFVFGISSSVLGPEAKRTRMVHKSLVFVVVPLAITQIVTGLVKADFEVTAVWIGLTITALLFLSVGLCYKGGFLPCKKTADALRGQLSSNCGDGHEDEELDNTLADDDEWSEPEEVT